MPFVQAAVPACEQQIFEATAFTVCRYDAARQQLEFILADESGPLRSFANLESYLGGRARSLAFAINAGMYDEEGEPIGLYVEQGALRHRLNLRDGPGNFHLKPNGVFAVDHKGRVSITPSEKWGAKRAKAQWATQSGPILVTAGKLHPRFDKNGESRLVRNGVGVRNARTAYFVISEEGVSFGRFARFFRDALGCANALYLDGTVSSLWDPGARRQDGYSSLGPMIAVFPRIKAESAPHP